MTDLSVVSQGALSEEHISSIREVQQAFAMYSLSVKLPIAFMAELRFRQVHTTVRAASPTCARDSCTIRMLLVDLHSNRLLQDPNNLLTHLISCVSCTTGKFAQPIICRTLSAVQDIVYGFKSMQLFNVGDLFTDLSQCRDAASSAGQHVLQQLTGSSLSNSLCMVDVLQSADLASWQTHRLTGLEAHVPLLLDMRSCFVVDTAT